MRLSEKTIETNFCSQISKYCDRDIIWFGLTQRQEAKLGFDLCTKLGGKLLVFQFKASNTVLKDRARQFKLSHRQLKSLQSINYSERNIFYVFPLIGNTYEFNENSNLIAQSRLLDVGCIPSNISYPTKKDGDKRKSGLYLATLSLHKNKKK